MKNLVIVIALVMIGSLANAQVKLFCDKDQSTISYYMHHPLHEWDGVSKEVSSVIITDESKDKINKVAVSVKIASFDSQNANRDSHVIEAAEGLLYPTISFTSDSIIQDGDMLNVNGTITFHGVSQRIAFKADKKKNKEKIEVRGSFILKMTQFKIEPPSLMGMATDDDFKIEFKMVY